MNKENTVLHFPVENGFPGKAAIVVLPSVILRHQKVITKRLFLGRHSIVVA